MSEIDRRGPFPALLAAALTAAVLALACGDSPTSPAPATPPTPSTTATPSAPTPLAKPTAATPKGKVLELLRGISGARTLSGQHNREPNSTPSVFTDAIFTTTGSYPALWSGDFLFQQESIDARGSLIQEAKREWGRGAIVDLMWHACPPDHGEPCEWQAAGGVLSHLDDAKWNELVTDGAPLNRAWKSRLDEIARYLKELQDAGVAVLWRPLHEMNQGQFWWGGRPGPHGTARLYQITHDYLEQQKGLVNLVWVWDVQDLDWSWASYDPGAGYWDVLAMDMYGDGYTAQKYEALLQLAGGKPIAIGECAKLPTPSELLAQPRWTFFMAWAELVYSSNSEQQIRQLYYDPRVVTLDEMPGWR
jgi:mannan endo-1,4-beta-mannosidase